MPWEVYTVHFIRYLRYRLERVYFGIGAVFFVTLSADEGNFRSGGKSHRHSLFSFHEAAAMLMFSRQN